MLWVFLLSIWSLSPFCEDNGGTGSLSFLVSCLFEYILYLNSLQSILCSCSSLVLLVLRTTLLVFFEEMVWSFFSNPKFCIMLNNFWGRGIIFPYVCSMSLLPRRAHQKKLWSSKRWKGQVLMWHVHSLCLLSSLSGIALRLFLSPRRQKEMLKK